MILLFDNDTEHIIDKPTKDLMQKSIEATLKYENFIHEAEISLTITTNNDIKKLNKQYRNIDKETDVLSFPLLDDTSNIKNMLHPVALGDIIISIEKAKSQALEYAHSIERELCFLCVHSSLHLLGYDHMTNKDEAIMFKKQDEILNSINITR